MTYPHDWQEMNIENVAMITTGSRDTKDNEPRGKYPFFVRSQNVERINVADFDCEAVLTAGDGVGTGKVFHYINGKFSAHQRVYVMSDFKNVDGKYFYYFFAKNFIKQVEKYTAKSSVDSVRRAMIAEMKIPVPPLAEQKAIAETLATFDEYIDALAALIDKKKNIRNGALEDLMSGKNRLPGFCDDWQEKKLGECVRQKLSYGINAPAINYDGKNPAYIRITDITDEGKFSGQDRKSVATQEQEKYTLHHGDILLARTGASTGKTYLYDEKDGSLVYAGFLIKASIDVQKYDPRFIFGQLRTQKYWAWVAATSMRSGQPGINSKEYASFSISVPPLAEQKAIAEVLSAMDEEIEALTAEREKIIALRAGAMDELLTGKIRLKLEA